MILFSERNNITEKPVFQKESLDGSTRNLLWNQMLFLMNNNSYDFENLAYYIWGNYLKNCLDEFPKKHNMFNEAIPSYNFLKKLFLDGEYYEIYDILEIVVQKIYSPNFIKTCNEIFEKENSAYRFINQKIVEIISDSEIKEIEDAVNTGISNVDKHLKQAIEHFSDRQNPDYRNSIKEAISAVEAICRNITQESTLDKALKKIENSGVVFDSQLKQGLEKFYYYTNGSDGIRHALMDNDNTSKSDAKFMLVMCCAFVNYIKDKVS